MPIDQAALLLIDVQQGFDDPLWGARNNPGAEENIAALLSYWRTCGRTVLHVQHCSIEPGSPLRHDHPGCSFKPEAKPNSGERIFQKSVNSAFIGTSLESELRAYGTRNLVIVGLTTDHCVSTTARMAANLGFETFVVHDATATFDRKGHDGRMYSAEQIHSTALASLHEEFATVISTAEALSGRMT